MAVHRCEHLKTNGQQCGSPALRAHRFCYFHANWQRQRIHVNAATTHPAATLLDMPVLEDHESIQMAVMQVMRLLISTHLDTKTAGLLLYGLQIASSNLRHAHFEPHAESVVIDLDRVPDTPLDANQWEEEDEEDEDDDEDQGEDELNEELGDDAEEEEDDEEEGQDAVSDAQFLKSLVGILTPGESHEPGTARLVGQKRPPATARSGTSATIGPRKNGQGGG